MQKKFNMKFTDLKKAEISTCLLFTPGSSCIRDTEREKAHMHRVKCDNLYYVCVCNLTAFDVVLKCVICFRKFAHMLKQTHINSENTLRFRVCALCIYTHG